MTRGLLLLVLAAAPAAAGAPPECRTRHLELNLGGADAAEFGRSALLAEERLSAACGLLEKGAARESLAALDEALALDPFYADARLHRALARERLGDAEGAGREFYAARKLLEGATTKVAGACACAPALSAEVKHLADRLGLGQKANARGIARLRARRFAEAAAAFTEAVARDPSDADAFHSRALSREGAGDRDGAVSDFATASRLVSDRLKLLPPSHPEAVALRARLGALQAKPVPPAPAGPAAGGPEPVRAVPGARAYGRGGAAGVAYPGPPMPAAMRGIDDADYDEHLKRFVRATSLLRRGRTREGIAGLKALSASLATNADYAFLYFESLSELAAAHLRTAEEPACRRPGAGDACLFPGGVQDLRADPKDAEEAIRVLEALLEIRPTDMQSRWLLNLAYMAAGRYPAGVPGRWLIPKEGFGTGGPVKRFRDAAPALGVDARAHAGGSVMEDFDGDGFLDIMASSLRGDEQLRFFRNKGDGTFEDRSDASGLKGIGGGLHLVQTDYDNDGRPDVFIPRQLDAEARSDGRCSLLRNLGGGRFEDVAVRVGLGGVRPSQSAAWGDYDNDGRLDLYLGNDDLKTGPPRLFRNKPDGTFADVTEEAGLLSGGFAVGANWGDYDNDGRLDLYVSFQGGDNALYRNLGPKGGRWRFEDAAARAGTTAPRASFSTWFWDYDNDGWEDILVFDFPMTPSAEAAAADALGIKYQGNHPLLYRNRGDGTFEDAAPRSGFDRSLMSMGSNFGDLDGDGWLDFYAGTGNPDLRSTVPNLVFRNEEGRSFREVTAAAGMGLLEKGHGISFGDVDNDGDEDVYVAMGGVYDADTARNSLFLNPGTGHRWLTVVLEGTRSSRVAVGARIRVDVRGPEGRRSIHRTVGTGGSFGGNSLQAEIGLGAASAVETVEVLWPATGKRQAVSGVPLDRFVRIVEGAPGFTVLERKALSLGTPR